MERITQSGDERSQDHKTVQARPSCDQKKTRMNRYVLFLAILASINSTLLGYDIGVMSGASVIIREYLKLNSVKVEVLVGILNLASLVGTLASGKTSDAIGRRYTILLAALTFFLGAILMGLAPSYRILLIGRIVAGFGVGYSLMIAPVYTAEISPASARGLLTSLPEFFIVFGILLGYIVNYALTDMAENINWRIMLGIAAIPAIVMGLGVYFMPESPRWLVMKGRTSEAREVLIKTSNSLDEAELRFQEILEANSQGANLKAQGHGVWKEILRPSRPIRRMLITAIGMNFFMQASGNDAVVYYTPEVFRAAGIHKKKHLFGVNVIMGLSKTAFVLVSALCLDRFGRRPLLLLGTCGMVISLGSLGLGSKFLEHSTSRPLWAIVVCIVAVCADVSFFSIGLGPITWVYSSEVFPSRLRAQCAAIAISVNRLVSGAVSLSFLSICNKISFGGMFFVLCGIMVLATLFFYFYLPETKGKSLEEIEALFEDKGKAKDKNVEMGQK